MLNIQSHTQFNTIHGDMGVRYFTKMRNYISPCNCLEIVESNGRVEAANFCFSLLQMLMQVSFFLSLQNMRLEK